jgi:hypothetical protein
MQNKPNFRKTKTTTTSCTARTYPNIPLRSARKNKAKTNPIPPHWESIENRVSSIKHPALFMQNKANVKMGNINISAAKTKAYPDEQ